MGEAPLDERQAQAELLRAALEAHSRHQSDQRDQLREQLAAALAAKYPTPEPKEQV